MNKTIVSALALAFVSAAAAAEPTTALGAMAAREQLLEVFENMPETRLKAVFLRCSNESSRRILALDEAVPCAMAWDALLERGFGGNVDALLAWWRFHRDDAQAR